eukprot:TCONS_00007469-protein
MHLKRQCYLSLDLSTQSLKALVTTDDLKIIFEHTINFDTDLPEFQTKDGVHRHPDGITITSPTLMWVKAIDQMLMVLHSSDEVTLDEICMVSGTAQQHGSVYWKKAAELTLAHLNSNSSLVDQLQECFAMTDSPVWMDASTTQQCRDLEQKIGGGYELAQLTGSRAFERFTANQITKIYRCHRESYVNCDHISLVSSFVASIFVGKYAPIDYSDGSGMNLLNIRTRKWEETLLDACAPYLSDRLGEPVPSNKIIGKVSGYLQQRYGFSPDCQVLAFTGDNPAALAGMCLSSGDVAVSLGTSDTLLFWCDKANPKPTGHVFVNPIEETEFMSMLCFKNGSLPRQEVCDRVCEGSWEKFNETLKTTQAGNNGTIAINFREVEILPHAKGVHMINSDGVRLSELEPRDEVRAVIEGQFLAKRLHAESFGFQKGSTSRILATGGASQNPAILQILSNVFNLPVYTLPSTSNATCIGCIYRCKQAALGGSKAGFFEAVKSVVPPKLVCEPMADVVPIYDNLMKRYETFEKSIADSDD